MNIDFQLPEFLYPERLSVFITKHMAYIVLCISIIISIAALVLVARHNLVLEYGDAESHINISKRVVSGLTPGFGQLGGVWLPLQHVLMIPFVINDTMWRTGVGGSIVSMISFVLTAIFLYNITISLTKSVGAGVTSALIFITNPNALYLQSTPLGEIPLIVMMVAAVYFFVRWAKTDNFVYIILAAFSIFCGSLIRYDAWFFIFCSIIFIPLVGVIKHYRLAKIESSLILYSSIAFFGMAFWVAWNYLIFKNPLYFLTSPYSAKTQQLGWLKKGQLPSYHNLPSSLLFYTVDITRTIGSVLIVLSAISLLIYVMDSLGSRKKLPELICLSLILSPYAFYVVTLYVGVSIILIPGLVPASYISQLFNVRYGIMMLPAVAVFVGLLWAKLKPLGRSLLYIAILFQLVFFLYDGIPIVLADGMIGLSGRKPNAANVYLAKHYDDGFVMFDDYSRTANPVSLNVPMQKIIYVGNHPIWDEALVHPSKYVRWLIIRQDENDALWSRFRNNKEFLTNYQEVFGDANVYVYKDIR